MSQLVILVATLLLSAPLAAEEKKTKLELSAEEQKVLDLTNAERKKADLPALKANAKLFAAARGHSANMAAKGVIAHELDGKNFDSRVKDQGYKMGAGGENCAMGQDTPAEAIDSWMQSAGHKANLLGKQYTEIGIGVAKDASGRKYWTQVFAAPLE